MNIDWEDDGFAKRQATGGGTSVNDWENPAIQGVNKEAPAAYRRHEEEWRLSLDGDWRFNWSPKPVDAPEGFHVPDFDDSNWGTIPVPGHWELNGHGIPVYTNIQYPFKPAPPTVPHDDNPTGCYRQEFEVPANWHGRRTFISFQGVDSYFELWINGQSVGLSKGSRNPAEFEIGPLLRPGRNLLAVKVLRWSDATYIEDQDMWWLSGIFRPVFLYSVPRTCIQDFEVKAEADGWLSVTTDSEAEIAIALSDDGEILFEDKFIREFRRQIESPKLWTAETPNLYQLSLRVPGQEIQWQVGFRTVKIEGGMMLVNGQSVKLRGVNRHDFNCDRGRVVTEADMLEDVRLLKEHNFNAVRASHYPNQSRWYELCDQFGLYVVDEADIETHGLRDALSKDPAWLPAFLARLQALVERDKNHACVICWSLGNESGFGANIQAMSDWLRRRDPSRPINYYHAGTDPAVDIVGMHYPSLEAIEALVASEPSGRPILLEEFAHSMGNSTGNMKEYWDLVERHSRLIGGFVWDWIDQGLRHKGGFAYGGDFGDQPNDGKFCLNGLLFPDRTPQPKLIDLKHVFQPVGISEGDAPGSVRLKNKFAFRDLSEFLLRWELKRDGAVVQSGELRCPKLPPGRETELRLPTEGGNFLNVFLLENGQCFAQEQFELEAQAEPVSLPRIPAGTRFDPKTGNLASFTASGRELFKSSPKFCLWRAPILNDRFFLDAWREVGYDQIQTTVEVLRFEPDGVFQQLAVVNHHGSALFRLFLSWSVHAEGVVELDYRCVPSRCVPPLPRFGLTLELPADFDKFRWFGRGPRETYRDRKNGALIDEYSGTVDEQHVPYPVPQENGNKTDVRWAELSDASGTGLRVEAWPCMETSVSRYSVADLDAAEHNYELTKRDSIFWHLDWGQAGVGNGSHGPNTLERYQLKPAEFRHRLRLSPI